MSACCSVSNTALQISLRCVAERVPAICLRWRKGLIPPKHTFLRPNIQRRYHFWGSFLDITILMHSVLRICYRYVEKLRHIGREVYISK
ncbi:hypothetical protein KCU75_g38, partial [Aureobasidium melanogenum]